MVRGIRRRTPDSLLNLIIEYQKNRRLFLKRLIVAISVITAVGFFCAVEDDAHAAKFLFVVELSEILDGRAVEQTGAYDEESGIGVSIEQLSVDNDIDRRTIDHNNVKLIANGVEELTETIAFKEFGGVGRTLTDGHDIQAFDARHGIEARPLPGEPI